jgi:hypothetical protein
MPAMARRADPAACAQQGAALLILLLLLVVLAGTVFVSQLKSAEVDLDAQRKTAAALAEAKQALLGRAASNDDPGSLPCPDNHAPGSADEGTADLLVGTACPSYVGRLPWRSLRLGDLRDGAGERLWYVLAPEFRDRGVAILPTLPGSINVIGTAPVAGVAAAIIAPGTALSGQNRAATTDRAQYLESYVDPVTLNTAAVGPAFNDRLMAVTAADIRRVSTQRMARELILPNLPHAYPANTGWFPTAGDWAGRWLAWLGVTNYLQVDSDNATLGFAGCAGTWAIRWDGARTVVNGSC